MRLGVMVALALAANLFAAPQAHAQDVLSRARQGELQCFQPDLARKTCTAISSYTPRADGQFDNGYRVLVAEDPVIVMTGSSPVFIRDGAVCGPLTRADLDAATFTIAGGAASAEDAATLRAQLAEMPDFIANEVCTTFVPLADGMRADVTIDGDVRPNSAHVIWVRIEDGFRVAP